MAILAEMVVNAKAKLGCGVGVELLQNIKTTVMKIMFTRKDMG